MEERIGARWFNWIGILAILFAVAYALKYSFDQGWITPRMRFRCGLGFGALLLGGGLYAERRRYPVLARGFWGGGIGAGMLVFFAGYQLLFDPAGIPILGRGAAFAGMTATVLIGIAIATVYDARTTAVLSAIAGYLTPVLLHSGEPDQLFLFTYLAILTAGLLALGYKKRWGFLRTLAFGAVVVSFGGWWALKGAGRPLVMLLYTSLMFLLFSAEVVAWSAWRRVVDSGASYLLLGLNTTLHVLVGLTVLQAFFPAYLGLFLLSSAGYHLGGALLVRRRHARDRLLVLVLAHAAAALFLLAPFFEPAMPGARLPVAWALQGALLFLAEQRWGGRGHLRGWGYAAFGLSAARLLLRDTSATLARVDPYLPLWNARGLVFGIVIALFVFACLRVRRRERAGSPFGEAEHVAATLLWILAFTLPAVFLSLELAQGLDTYVAPRFADHAGRYANQAAHWMTVLWACYATLVATVSSRRGAGTLRAVALAFGAFVLAKYIARDLVATYVPQTTLLFHTRAAVTAVLAACLFWTAREFRFLRSFALVAAHLLILCGIGMEWVDFCGTRGLDSGFFAGGAVRGLTLLVAGYATVLVARGTEVLRLTGLLLAAAAAVKWLALDAFAAGEAATTLFFQLRFLAAASAVAAALYAAGRAAGRRVPLALRLLAHLVAVAALSFEIHDLFAGHPVAWLSVQRGGTHAVFGVWALYGLGALRVGHARLRPHLRACGLTLLFLAFWSGLVVLPDAPAVRRLFANTRLFGLAATATGLLFAAELYRCKEPHFATPLRLGSAIEGPRLGALLALAGHGLMMLLLTLEASDYFRRAGARAPGATLLEPENARQLSISLLWSLYAIGMIVGGFLRHYRPVRLMALAVLALTILKVFFSDLSFLENPYRILSFFVLGAILVAVSFLYQRFRAHL